MNPLLPLALGIVAASITLIPCYLAARLFPTEKPPHSGSNTAACCSISSMPSQR